MQIDIPKTDLDLILTALVSHKTITKSKEHKKLCEELYHKYFKIYMNS